MVVLNGNLHRLQVSRSLGAQIGYFKPFRTGKVLHASWNSTVVPRFASVEVLRHREKFLRWLVTASRKAFKDGQWGFSHRKALATLALFYQISLLFKLALQESELGVRRKIMPSFKLLESRVVDEWHEVLGPELGWHSHLVEFVDY